MTSIMIELIKQHVSLKFIKNQLYKQNNKQFHYEFSEIIGSVG